MKQTVLAAAMGAAFSALAQVPANPNNIAIEVGPGNTVTDTVRTTNTTRNVTLTRNPQDNVVITNPAVMTMGLHVDASTVIAPGPGYPDRRVKDTLEQPVVTTQAAFRTVCTYAWLENTDFIVYPGIPLKSHKHFGLGNVLGKDPFQTTETIRVSGNSTCRGGIANRSAYWVPTLMDVTDSKPILPSGFNIYYKGQPTEYDEMNELPTGLKMVAGDPNATAEYTKPFAYRWNCRLPNSNVNQFSQSIPQDPVKCPIGSTIGAEVFFPVCWDGVNKDSPDHKSHMSYMVSGIPNPPGSPAGTHKGCPPSHPKQIPHLSFNYSYKLTTDVRNLRIVTDAAVSATKKPGVGLHGDYAEAWETAVMQMWVNNCLRAKMDCHSHLLGKDPADGKFKAIY